MAETAAHLVYRVLPAVPVRQWVLTLPFALRYLVAFDAELLAAVRRRFVDAVFAWPHVQALIDPEALEGAAMASTLPTPTRSCSCSGSAPESTWRRKPMCLPQTRQRSLQSDESSACTGGEQ